VKASSLLLISKKDFSNWTRQRLKMDNGNTNMESTGFQFQANSTSKWDNELKFAAAGSVRTSIIVLAVFNLVVAFAITLVILLRSWRTLKRTESWDFK
jgi:hypothetical protein